MNRKTLLIIGAGAAQLHAFKLAREMGLNIVATDMISTAPGFEFADEALIASTYDLDATLKVVTDYHNRNPIDGVMSVGVDNPLITATIADNLGLPGIPIDSAMLGSDKYKMKLKFTESGIAVPKYTNINSLSELREFMADCDGEVVIKPTDSRGARGIIRITEGVDIEWAYNYAIDISPSSSILVDEFISGPQLSTESIIYKGEAYTVAFSDRNYEFLERFAPFIIENGGTMPSQLDDSVKEEISSLINQIAICLGIENGVIKGDLVVGDDGVQVIEVATRLSGGYFCTDQVIQSTGVDLVKAAINIALGEDVNISELEPKYHRHIDKKYFFLSKGRINKIMVDEKIRENKWLTRYDLFVSEGDETGFITDHTKRSGVVICSGETREEAIKHSRSVIESVSFEIE